MKKQTALALAAVFAMSVAGTALAAPNAFADVPAKHWAYDSVNKLAKAGVVSGYGDNTYKGDKTLTRYEIAVIIAKAMNNTDKMDTETKAALNKLQAEFGSELNNIGVRMDKLEKNASSIKLTGDARVRYQNNYDTKGEDNVANDNKTRFQERVRLYVSAPVGDKIEFNGRLTHVNTSNKGTSGSAKTTDTSNFNFDTAKFTYKEVFANTNLVVGRDSLLLGQGLLSDTSGNYDNAALVYKNDNVKAFVSAGDVAIAAGSANSVNITVANVDWKVADNTNITLAALQSRNESTYAFKNVTVGGKYKFGDFSLVGEYTDNKADAVKNAEHKGAFAQLWYKGADMAKVGTGGVYAEYLKVGAKAIDGDLTTLNLMNETNGIKGFGLGFNYTFAKNAKLTTNWDSVKSFNGAKKFDSVYTLKAEMKF